MSNLGAGKVPPTGREMVCVKSGLWKKINKREARVFISSCWKDVKYFIYKWDIVFVCVSDTRPTCKYILCIHVIRFNVYQFVQSLLDCSKSLLRIEITHQTVSRKRNNCKKIVVINYYTRNSLLPYSILPSLKKKKKKRVVGVISKIIQICIFLFIWSLTFCAWDVNKNIVKEPSKTILRNICMIDIN